MNRRVAVVGGVVAALVVGAFGGAVGVAWFRPPVDTSPIDNATKSIQVTALVEERPVRDLYSLSAQVPPEATVAVMPLVAGPGREVVSGEVHKPGDVIHYGDVVGEVSGRPVFAVSASLPLYRDLFQGDSGSDALGVQQLVSDLGLYTGPVDGGLGAMSVAGIAALYTRAGYDAPDPPGLLMVDVAAVPADALTVAGAAAIGEEISADHPLLRLVTSPAVITARVDMLQATAFTVGTTVNVQVGSAAPVTSTVTAVSGFQESTVGTPPGYDITVAMPAGVDPVTAQQQPVLVSETVTIPTGLAVPLAAIRYGSAGGAYVVLPPLADGATPAPPRTVPVTVVSQSGGYAIIGPTPDLPAGTAVIIAGG